MCLFFDNISKGLYEAVLHFLPYDVNIPRCRLCNANSTGHSLSGKLTTRKYSSRMRNTSFFFVPGGRISLISCPFGGGGGTVSSGVAVADLHWMHSPRVQIISISCSFSERFGKIVCWKPPPPSGGLTPHRRKILDLSLDTLLTLDTLPLDTLTHTPKYLNPSPPPYPTPNTLLPLERTWDQGPARYQEPGTRDTLPPRPPHFPVNRQTLP